MFQHNELYEVKCTIKNEEYANTFKKYMIEKHIPDILKTNCFKNIYFVNEEDELTFKISYFAENKNCLDKYLNEYAPALREDFIKNIDVQQVNVSRRFANCASFSHISSFKANSITH